jgi:ABC-type lipoprotein release transport system permease subunit
VRIALGAPPLAVMRMVLSQTSRPVLYGLLAGMGFAASLATALIAMPFGFPVTDIVHVADPAAYAASLIVILAACVLAGALPAARAARVNPMHTLRQE